MNAISSKPKHSKAPADITIEYWLANATQQLNTAHIPTARLDALILLADALTKDRAWILAHPEFTLSPALVDSLQNQLQRRMEHEPLAYIRERCEFYGRTFYVDQRVLVPRPESETMIELVSTLQLPATVTIADIGTGSGALGITAALELIKIGKSVSKTVLIDIDPGCLAVAKINSSNYQLPVTLLQNHLAAGIPVVDVILANLPYVPDSHTINKAAMIEPKIAIFGGSDGLDLYRTMFTQLSSRQRSQQPKFICTESLPFQHAALASIANTHSYQLKQTDDFIQIFSPAETF